MKSVAGIAIVLLGGLLPFGALRAAEGGPSRERPPSRMQEQLTRLIGEDLGRSAPEAPAPPALVGEVDESTVEMAPMVITAEQVRELPRTETKVQRFLRTGTIWEKPGRTFSGHFWLHPLRGVGFSLSW